MAHSAREQYISVAGAAVLLALNGPASENGTEKHTEMPPMWHLDPPPSVFLWGVWTTALCLPHM
jgi:hypothetical protein